MALKIMEKDISLPNYCSDIHTDVVSYVKEYHVYKNVWITHLQEKVHGEIQPKNPVEKYVATVKKDAKTVEHLPLRKNGKCKNFFFISFELIRTESVI